MHPAARIAAPPLCTSARQGAVRRLAIGVVAIVAALLVAASTVVTPTDRATALPPVLDGQLIASDPASAEQQFVQLLNQTRAAHGLRALVVNTAVADTSRSWSRYMSVYGLKHDPNLQQRVGSVVPGWTRIGENVGVGWSVQSLHDAFYRSSGHRANMLGAYNQVGVGVHYGSDGKLWVTFRFVNGPLPKPSPKPDRVGVHRPDQFLLRSSLSAGGATTSYSYGNTGDVAFLGDWDGNGTMTPGVFRDGTWYLRNSNTAGAADIVFSYGHPTDTPVVGDWDGNGTDTIGIRRRGNWALRNWNSGGRPSYRFDYGLATDVPVVGDWDGNGTDTIGIRRSANWALRNWNSPGRPTYRFDYGLPSDTPVVGDWDGNRTDTIGIRRSANWALRNSNSAGGVHHRFDYGISTDRPLVGGF